MANVANADSKTAHTDKTKGMSLKVWGGIAFAAVVLGGAAGAIAVLLSKDSKSGMPLKGTWVTGSGSYVTITDDTWYSVASWGTSVYAISKYTDAYSIAQNPADDNYNPSLWRKEEYHAITDNSGPSFAWCSSVYNAATAAAAEATDTSVDVDGNGDVDYNAADAAKGCNGFSFSTLTAYANPYIGTFNDNWGSTFTVTATEVGGRTIEAWGDSWILAQNAADDAYNPSLWSLFKFHTNDGGQLGYCQIVYNGATAAAALTADISASYNAANMLTDGCNGFGHTLLTPA
jgi:hypothetical protein